MIRTSVAALNRALVDAVLLLADSPAGRGAAAVLCPTKAAADGLRALLNRAGVAVQSLEDYDGTTSAAVKVGTYLRAKGLEFKHVYLPRYDDFLRAAERGGAADADYLQLHRNQVYVGMTRPRDTLWLGSVALPAARHRPDLAERRVQLLPHN